VTPLPVTYLQEQGWLLIYDVRNGFTFDSLLPWLDLAGLSVFAASGALAAGRKRLDFDATL